MPDFFPLLLELLSPRLPSDGEIKRVVNTKTKGSDGPIVIETKNQPIQIDLNKSGQSTNNRLKTTVTGGGATININGNNNHVTVGGTKNTVNMNGVDNFGTGENAKSGGTVNIGGRRNRFNSNGGNWNVGN